jgi:hypothetical protein
LRLALHACIIHHPPSFLMPMHCASAPQRPDHAPSSLVFRAQVSTIFNVLHAAITSPEFF